jgi:ATPase family associated with various cellular activities (AAA)
MRIGGPSAAVLTPMRKSHKPRNRSRRWDRFLAMAAEAGQIAMSLRDRPTRLDWIAVGIRAVGLGFQARAEHRRLRTRNPWSFFDTEGPDRVWVAVPDEFQAIVLEHVGDVVVDLEHWDGESDSTRVYLGTVGGEQIGWLGDKDGKPADGPYVRVAREVETYRALGERVWQRIGSRHCAYGRGGLAPDALAGDPGGASEQVRALHERLASFLERGVRRSCLLVGPPGTGKSTGIRYLARMLGMRSLRVDLAALGGEGVARVDDEAPIWLDALLKVLRPELLILDDLDRVASSGQLLHFLELAAATCRLVLASANGTERMMGAALRPGRFDEIVRVDRLDPDLLRKLLGADADLCDRLDGLPVAYVSEFMKRRQVLGRDRALAELDELCARRNLVEGAPDREDG